MSLQARSSLLPHVFEAQDQLKNKEIIILEDLLAFCRGHHSTPDLEQCLAKEGGTQHRRRSVRLDRRGSTHSKSLELTESKNFVEVQDQQGHILLQARFSSEVGIVSSDCFGFLNCG